MPMLHGHGLQAAGLPTQSQQLDWDHLQGQAPRIAAQLLPQCVPLCRLCTPCQSVRAAQAALQGAGFRVEGLLTPQLHRGTGLSTGALWPQPPVWWGSGWAHKTKCSNLWIQRWGWGRCS